MLDRFAHYARYYDLLNRDKAYPAEADYVLARLHQNNSKIERLLELGSGTGRHGKLLAQRGLHVQGVELSEEMVEIGRAGESAAPGSFDCIVGDIRSVRLNRRFDAAVSLFHVMSYLISPSDFAAGLETATSHLGPGGLFLFDVWHGPAVLSQKPHTRERIVAEGDLKVVRTARPELRARDNTVVVNYDFQCSDAERSERFTEQHVVRYFFPEEILAASARASFSCLGCEEMVTGAPPSEQTWAVTYLLQKQ